jgi:cytochrome c oxidase assembly protein subunit 15
MPKQAAARAVSNWLFVMSALVALMVIVGGATRLTDSGLSIVEWRPVTGVLPPLAEAAWQAEFEKYRQIPEYALVNAGMSPAEFKEIYWWEWGHRFLGRLVGVAFFVPLVWFVATGAVSRAVGVKLFGLFLLGGAQGALGWWMVKSGLSDRIDVSQYRLAAHLALALLLFALMFWLALDVRRPRAGPRAPLFWGALALSAGVFAQAILGAFVAGLRAGRTFNTWPLMDGEFFPRGYFAGSPDLSDLFETVAAVQFNHRLGAYLLIAGAIWFFFAARRAGAVTLGALVLGVIAAQAALGIATVLAGTPLALGLLHQAGAIGVLAVLLCAAHSSSGAGIAGSGMSSVSDLPISSHSEGLAPRRSSSAH